MEKKRRSELLDDLRSQTIYDLLKKGFIWLMSVVGSSIVAFLVASLEYLRSHVDWFSVGIGFVLTLPIFLGLTLYSATRTSKRKRVRSTKIEIVDFDYLPSSPLDHGWTLLKEARQSAPPKFTRSLDAPSIPSLAITAIGWYGMDYDIPLHATACNRLVFIANFSKEGRFYTRIEVVGEDGSPSQKKWLQFYASSFDEMPRMNENEWVFSITGEPLGKGWTQYSVSLIEKVNLAATEKHLSYKQLHKIRLRGSMLISTIELWQDTIT